MVEGAESFFLGGNRDGVLLIHGFTGLPAEMLLLGQFLNRKGFTVHCPRLAGHGVDERALMRTTKDDWFDSVVDGAAVLRGVCDKISVVGHSMGGLLALKLAAVQKVSKLATLAAPIFIDDGLGLCNLPPREFCSDACIVQPRKILDDVPAGVNNPEKKTPLVSVHELLGVIADAKKILPTVTAPILIMHGEDDHTAQPRSARFITDNVGSKDKRVVTIPKSGHLLPLAEERDLVFDLVADFLTGGHER